MKLTTTNGKPVTMTSLELVDFINSQRKEGDAELRHDNFLAKVPQVLGEEVALNFKGNYKAANGKQNPLYTFPKREACLMAMSYSYEIQAKVFDRMTQLEERIQKVGAGETAKALANPTGATRAHLMVVSAMEKMGVRKEMAMAGALQAIHDDTGLTTEGYRLALPGVEDVCNLNQKQLGDLLGVSSKAVGNLLRNTGLMVIDEAGQRVVTEKGRQFGEMKPFKAFNGHAGYEPRWNKSVLEFFAQQAKEAA